MVNFNSPRSCILFGFFFFLFSIHSAKLTAQIDFPDKLSLQQYLTGTWELSRHSYSIAGIVDEYPTDLESYQLVFEPGVVDSLLSVGVYRNFCLKQELEIIISASSVSGGGCQWTLQNFPSLFAIDMMDRFVCSDFQQSDLTLWDGYFDGSFFDLRRTPGFTPLDCVVPDDFEFLQHTQPVFASPRGIEMLTVESGVLYVSHNNQGAMTSVYIAGYDNTLDTLYQTSLSSASKIYELSDTSYQVILYNLIDYDVAFSGYIELVIMPSGVTVTSKESAFNDLGLGWVSAIGKDTLDHLWFSNQSSVFSYDGDSIIFQASHRGADFLYENVVGNMYGLQADFSDVTTRIVHILADGNLDTVLVVPDGVLDIKRIDSSNYLLLGGELIEYNFDFSQILNSWSTPYVSSFKSIDVTAENIFVVESQVIVDVMDNQWDTVYVANNVGERMSSVLQRPDKSILVAGDYNFLESAFYTFFRNLPLSYVPEYDKIHVELEEFVAIPGIRDTSSVFETEPGDTVYIVIQPVDLNFSIRNMSTDIIRVADVITNRHLSAFGLSLRPGAHFNGGLAVGDSTALSTTFRFYPLEYFGIEAGVVGANFKFNIPATESIPVDVLSSTQHLYESEKSLRLYPNPTESLLSIQSNVKILDVAVYNLSGALLIEDRAESGFIDVSSLSSGMYVIKVYLDGYKDPRLIKFTKI